MEQLDGTTIFWMISLGLLIGGALKLLFGKGGLSIALNVGGGVLGVVIVGTIGIEVQIAGSLLFAGIGTIAILFLGNVFFVGEEHHTPETKKEAV